MLGVFIEQVRDIGTRVYFKFTFKAVIVVAIDLTKFCCFKFDIFLFYPPISYNNTIFIFSPSN